MMGAGCTQKQEAQPAVRKSLEHLGLVALCLRPQRMLVKDEFGQLGLLGAGLQAKMEER